MSRVFEALSKANAARERQVEKPKVVAKNNILREVVPAFVNDRPGVLPEESEERRSREEIILPTATSVTAPKSWRERVEEFLFGWDLTRYNSHPIVALEQDSTAAGQYKILREQIKRLRVEAGVQSFTITSPVKRDGKTTVAVNLAAVLALDYEQKVLLIDGDLRAPGVHRYFNVSGSPGLAEYLSSNTRMSIRNLVQSTFLPGLKIIPSGKPSHLSSELLAKEKMQEVLDDARTEFPGYQIIIDSPPVLSTPDPMIIARHVDGVLLVVRAGKTPRDYLTKALQSLNSAKVMGVVLNGAELGMASKYYYYTTAAAS